MNDAIIVNIMAGQDGGLVVYEAVDAEQTLVFGGDLDAVTKYLNTRLARIVHQPEQAPPTRPGLREAPISAALRRLEDAVE